MNLLRRHSVEYSFSHLDGDERRQLKRSLTWVDIAVLGISISVGAGIFSVGAKVITTQAGPAAILSFLLSATVCALAAMCYAEFSSALPIAGSSYTYSYSVLGEVVAWFIGWNVILELFMAASVIVKYWAIYLKTGVQMLGGELPSPLSVGGVEVDWPIFIGVGLFAGLLILGTKISTKTAQIFVIIKIAVILIVVFGGLMYFSWDNLAPFIPEAQVGDASGLSTMQQSLITFCLGLQPQLFGVFGIFTGAATIFFAFIGFDSASTAAEETINPRRNVPIGLMVGIGVVSLLYIMTAFVTAGMVNPGQMALWLADHPGVSPSLATAFEIHGNTNFGAIISFGSLAGLTTVVLGCMLGLGRIIFAMSRDGLMPAWLSVTSKRKTPARIQIITAALIACVAAFTRVDALEEMINIGTVCAFIVVSFSVPILRKQQAKRRAELLVSGLTSDLEGSFKVPLSPFLPILSGCVCIWLAVNLSIGTWLFFLIWVSAGLLFYFLYGYRHSALQKNPSLSAK